MSDESYGKSHFSQQLVTATIGHSYWIYAVLRYLSTRDLTVLLLAAVALSCASRLALSVPQNAGSPQGARRCGILVPGDHIIQALTWNSALYRPTLCNRGFPLCPDYRTLNASRICVVSGAVGGSHGDQHGQI